MAAVQETVEPSAAVPKYSKSLNDNLEQRNIFYAKSKKLASKLRFKILGLEARNYKQSSQQDLKGKKKDSAVTLKRSTTISTPFNFWKAANLYFAPSFFSISTVNSCQCAHFYTRFSSLNKYISKKGELNYFTHVEFSMLLPSSITTRELFLLFSNLLSADINFTSFSLRWIRQGCVEERIFSPDESPLLSRSSGSFEDCCSRFYLCEHSCHAERRNLKIESNFKGTPATVVVEVSCMLFVRHILQFSLSRLNRLDNQNLDDYQLSFTDSAGNIKVLGIWDCPGCCPAETLLLSAQPPMVATEIHPKKNNLVTRLSKKITKTLRNPLSYYKSQKSMPSIGSDTAKQLSPTRTDKNFFSVTEKNLQKFPKKTTAYSSLHSLHAAIPSTLEKQDPYELGVFGALIADATHSGSILPAPLLLCFSYVETFGLNLQGIYRISGGHLKMKNIRDSFQRGEVPNFQSITAHNVAGVVKCFYREIPEPFIPPTSKLSELKELEVDSDEMIGALNLLVKELPPGNLLLLRALFRHLHLVHLNSAKNMMPAENLAVVFQPNLGLSTNLVICLIKEYPQIFQDDFKVVPLNFSDFC